MRPHTQTNLPTNLALAQPRTLQATGQSRPLKPNPETGGVPGNR